MTRAAESNARDATKTAVIAELREWAERLHHLSMNSMLAGMEPGENRDVLAGVGTAYGSVAEWMARRAEEINAELDQPTCSAVLSTRRICELHAGHGGRHQWVNR